MIVTNLKRMERYLGLCPTLDSVIRFLGSADLDALKPGRNEVDGDRAVVNCYTYTTIPLEEAGWEGHERYADVHVVLSGQERMGVSDASHLRMTSRDEQADLLGFEGTVDTWVDLRAGDVLIVFPEDAHMVKVHVDGPSQVRKAVGKILVK